MALDCIDSWSLLSFLLLYRATMLNPVYHMKILVSRAFIYLLKFHAILLELKDNCVLVIKGPDISADKKQHISVIQL